MTREEWLAQRRTVLTASDVAAVLGLNPHNSRERVLQEKAGLREPANLDKIPAVASGRHLEAGILAWFAEDHPEYSSVKQNGPELVMSPQYDRLAATPDGFAHRIVGSDLVEVKNVGKPWNQAPGRLPGLGYAPVALEVRNVGRASDGAFFPLPYWIQLQVQMHCTGARLGWLTGCIAGQSRADRLFAFDAEFEPIYLEAAVRLWREVRALEELNV